MQPALTLLAILAASCIGFSQDVQIRQEALQLLERANAVSSSAQLPNLERTDTFRAFSSGSIQEGSFSRVVIQGTGRRDEYNFGDFHLVNVWTHGTVAATGSSHIMPAELVTLLRLTPINRLRFDHEDVIHSVVDREVSGSGLAASSSTPLPARNLAATKSVWTQPTGLYSRKN